MKVAPMVIRASPKRPVNSRPVLASALNAAMNALTPCARCAGLAWMKLRAASSQAEQDSAEQDVEAHAAHLTWLTSSRTSGPERLDRSASAWRPPAA